MRFTQQILGRKKPALEAEEVVDQSVIDSLPAETETPAEAEAPADDVVADATEPTVADEPAVPVEGEATDLPAEEPVAEPVADEPGAGEIVPPDAEAVDVAPTTADGTVTVDQVESVLAGDEPEAAEAVAEADTLAGEPTTPEEVVAETDQVQEALGDDAAATDLPSEPGLPGDEPGSDLPVDSIEPGVDGGAVEEPASDTGTDEPLSDEPAAVDEPVAEPTDATDGVEGGEPAALEDGQTAETPAPSDAPLPGTDPATEDCACEEGDLGAQDVVAAQVDEAEVPVGDGEGIAQTDAPIEGAGTETLGEPGADPIAEPATDEVVADDDNFDFEPHATDEADETESQVLGEALDTYPQVTALLEDSLDNGGISNEAMQLLNIFTKRDGVPVNSNIALESYNHTARTQTRVALEGLKENIGQWLKDFLANFLKRVEDFYGYITKLFDSGERLKAKIAKVKELVASGAQPKSGVIAFSGVNDLVVEGSVKNFTNDFSSLAQFAKMASVLITEQGHDVAKQAIDIFKDKVMEEKNPTLAGEELEEVLSKFTAQARRLLPNTDNGYASDLLPGDVKFVADVDLIGNSDRVSNLKFAIVKKGSETSVDEVTALSVGDIEKILNSANNIIETIEHAKQKVEQSKALVNEFKNDFGTISRIWETTSDGAETKVIDKQRLNTVITRVSNVVLNLAITPVGHLSNYLLKTVNGALNYSIASLGKDEATPAAEEPAQA